MNRVNGLLISALLVGVTISYAITVHAFDGVTLTADYIVDKGAQRRSFLDKQIRLDYRRVFVAGFLGDYQKGGEIGGSILDRRRSAYSLTVRRRENDRMIQPGVEWVLGKGFVLKGEVRFIKVDEPESPITSDRLTVYGVGLDRYYGDYHYASLMFYSDPRGSGRFGKMDYSIILSNTWADLNRSVRLGLIPRSDRTVGYFMTARYHWLLIAYAYTREFDFTALDRRVATIGLQIPFDRRWSRPEE
jgi:hypothetical protein